MICTHHQILLENNNQEKLNWLGMWHVWGRGRVGAYRILVRKSEEKRQITRSRGIWEDNIKTYLTEMALRAHGMGPSG